MTKKDYIMLAKVIGEAWAEELGTEWATPAVVSVRSRIRFRLVDNLTRELQRDNPRFDAERFTAAVENARVGS